MRPSRAQSKSRTLKISPETGDVPRWLTMKEAPPPDAVLEATRAWVERAVIGLNLCPFARAVQSKGLVRYIVSEATTARALASDLERELLHLSKAPPAEIDTTLLIHPQVLHDFLDYNDFLATADALLARLRLEGELQIASFHPDYCFSDSEADDPANYTNRSPYPILHLLREASVSRAVDAYPEPHRIYERNIAALRALSRSELERLRRGD